MTFHATANKDGTLSFSGIPSRQRWMLYCEFHAGKDVLIQPQDEKRGKKQNSFYWVVITEVAKTTGNDVEEIHKIFKARFLKPKIVTIGGKEYRVARSTTELTVPEFAEYTERVVAEAADLGILIPTAAERERADIRALYE